MATYEGARTIDGIKVRVDGQPLNERRDIHDFTNMGFEWTYEGASPRQLSLAILSHHMVDDDKALASCEAFMKSVVAVLDNDWVLTTEEIDEALGHQLIEPTP